MNGYGPTVYLAMFGWIPVVLAMCAYLPPRRAVVMAFVIAWSFLPMASFKFIQGIPEYTKMSATCGGVLLAAFIFDFDRILSFRPKLVDIPAFCWCLCPVASSLSNGLGPYDGFSMAFRQTVAWGIPYFLGRLYLGDLHGLRELAIGSFLGALAYVPLCIYELRMSPQLHHQVYGYHAHAFIQSIRFGGYRPTVFMQHGLMVGMWMAMGSLTAIWLLWTGTIRRVFGLHMFWMTAAIVGTAAVCKSVGALCMMAGGLAVLVSIKMFNTRLVLLALILVAPAYFTARIVYNWDASNLGDIAETFSPERAQSLEFRQTNEKMLLEKAMLQPVYGWGGWSRGHVYDAAGRDITVIDGLWIDVLSMFGLFGLISFTLLLLFPPLLLMWQVPPALWKHPMFASVAVVLVMNVLYMIDDISNAMVNPIYMLAAGGMAGFAANGARAAIAMATRSRKMQMRGTVVVQGSPIFGGRALGTLLDPMHRPRPQAT